MDSLKENFDLNGFVAIKNFLSNKEISEINDRVAHLVGKINGYAP